MRRPSSALSLGLDRVGKRRVHRLCPGVVLGLLKITFRGWWAGGVGGIVEDRGGNTSENYVERVTASPSCQFRHHDTNPFRIRCTRSTGGRRFETCLAKPNVGNFSTSSVYFQGMPLSSLFSDPSRFVLARSRERTRRTSFDQPS